MQYLKNALRQVMEEGGVSLSAIGRKIGWSPAALSQWLSGTYPGNTSEIDEAIRGYLERLKEKSRTSRKKIDFILTSVAKKVFEVARICHLDGEVGVCCGYAGLGKTMALREYSKRNSDVILVEADLGYTAKTLFLELHKALGLDGKGLLHELFDGVVGKLKNSERLIIIDEAEHLPYRALELLRRVHDKAEVGILLAGMPRLRSNLTGRRGEYAQLYSRVGISAMLERLKTTDTEALVHAAIPSVNGLWKTYHEVSNANARLLSKLLLRSARIAEINNLPVSAEIIKESAKTLIV